ncbi:MAG TPA: hypothetical protein ENK57_12095 [Polyangiaceae bacterium]|nr:hypothetical protein [Polyangiaceae bacterium]
MSPAAVVAALCSEFGFKERAAWRYIAKARKRWEEEAERLGPEARETAREQMRRTLRYVKSRGFKSGDLPVVLKATKQLRDLDGLDVPKEFRLSGSVDHTVNIFAGRTTEDLIAFLRTGRLPIEEAETDDG